MKRIVIFDLDETVIDSKHRTPNHPDGTLNLEAYFAQKNRDNIFKDQLLPLVNIMRNLCRQKNYVVICTARQMGQDDYDFLETHGIHAHCVLCRNPDGSDNHFRDAAMKRRKIQRILNLRQFQNLPVYMFDDAKPVISEMRKMGIVCLNSIKINSKLGEKT